MPMHELPVAPAPAAMRTYERRVMPKELSDAHMSIHSCIVSSWSDARVVLLHGLADRSRLALVEQLADGGRRVSDLVVATGLTQTNVSKHLACLWDCGLVERERHGREIHYRLVDGLDDLLTAADRVLERTGDRVMACPRYGALAARREAA
jgi:ArsR family transcriptional regulator, cadmium/lead-responsive transcriptional repressor